MSRRRQRILIYSHDTYGLGHLRRSLLIADRLVAGENPPTVLIATGSARAHSFEYPRGVDTLKLPSIVKNADGHYTPRSLDLPLQEVLRIRSELLLDAVRSFGPDIILVDHAPAGLEGELRPLFRAVATWEARPSIVLGLRDIIDHPDRVREEWDRLGVWGLLDSVYDQVLVYGDSQILTTAQELGLVQRLGDKLTHVGYLGRAPTTGERAAISSPPRVLVTAGGGGDGHGLLRAYASFLEHFGRTTPFVSTIVTGPFLSKRRQVEISQRLEATRQPVEILTFTDSMEDLVQSAAAVVCMTGYNTAVEVLAAGVPALFLPREVPRLEQTIRAERMARLAGLDWCPVGACTPERLRQFVVRALASERPRGNCPIDVGGLDRVAKAIERLGVRSAKTLHEARVPTSA